MLAKKLQNGQNMVKYTGSKLALKHGLLFTFSSYLFNLHAEYLLRKVSIKRRVWFKSGGNTNNLHNFDDITLIAKNSKNLQAL